MSIKNLKDLYKDAQATKQYWQNTAKRKFSDDSFWEIVDRELYDNSWIITVNAFLEGGNISSGTQMLEVGCGWGRTMIGVKKEFPEVKIVGIDLVETFLKRGKAVLERELSAHYASFQVGDALNLSFADNSFDAVCSTRVFQYVSDPVRALKEIHRVLRPGARAAIIVPNQYNPFQIARYHTKLYSPFDVAGWFREAGFQVLEARSINFFPSRVYRFKYNNRVLRLYEATMQKIPVLKMLGGLSFVYGIKV